MADAPENEDLPKIELFHAGSEEGIDPREEEEEQADSQGLAHSPASMLSALSELEQQRGDGIVPASQTTISAMSGLEDRSEVGEGEDNPQEESDKIEDKLELGTIELPSESSPAPFPKKSLDQPPDVERHQAQRVTLRSYQSSQDGALRQDAHAQSGRRQHVRSRKACVPQSNGRPAYRQAWPMTRNPLVPWKQWPCSKRVPAGPSVHDYAGPAKTLWRRHDRRRPFPIAKGNVSPRHPTQGSWQVNPAATVPMRPLPWKRKSWMRTQSALPAHAWKVKEEESKARQDRNLALKLGYETLVGNLVHIDIPGSSDLNRSWRHFLHQDPLSWGFPYWRGSTERAQMPPPSPYLVYQLREKLWKQPRVRLFNTQATE